MPSLNGILSIAGTGLNASQEALDVTSHNIANVNTPGYTRQRAVLRARDPLVFGGMYFGTGVEVSGVERVYDRFIGVQLNDARSGFSANTSRAGVLQDLEGILNDLGGTGLSKPLDDFFNSFEELSTDPSSRPARQAVLSSGAVLGDAFTNMDTRLRRDISNVNSEIRGIVKEINNLTAEVAHLNGQIQGLEINGASSNDLKDKRDEVLGELAGKIGITTIESESGVVDVMTDGGLSLVSGLTHSTLSVAADKDNSLLTTVTYNGADLTSTITTGELGGYLHGRADLVSALHSLNLLAASVTKEVNVQHRAGYGLDSSTGLDFFSPMIVETTKKSQNTGGALISGGTITDPSALTLDDYEIRFSGPLDYVVVNTGTNAVVKKGTYTSGSAITFDGLSVTIADGATGPVGGDTFGISVTNSAAMHISVSLSDPSEVAASGTSTGLPGDNSNALALSALRDKTAVNGSTFSAYYQGLVAEVGTKANETGNNLSVSEAVVSQLEFQRDSVSGVSMDEETVNMIKLQKAFEASARLMTTVDKMFDTLLSIR